MWSDSMCGRPPTRWHGPKSRRPGYLAGTGRLKAIGDTILIQQDPEGRAALVWVLDFSAD